jgi:beta-phosphoglucomutase-like phosphatase (HAD superfamily)
MRERPLLVLVDVGDVLLLAPDEPAWHRRSLEEAVRQLTGLDARVSQDRRGHTDYTLLVDAFARLGLGGALTRPLYRRIAATAAVIYERLLPDRLDGFLRPGATAAMELLRSEPWVRLVPISGASAPSARCLIERARVDGPLQVGYGSFCDYGTTRPDLIRSARARAGWGGMLWPADRTVLLTAQPADLLSARAAGVRCVLFGHGRGAAEHTALVCDELPALVRRFY